MSKHPRCHSCRRRRPVSYAHSALLCADCERLWADASTPPQPDPLTESIARLREHHQRRRSA